MVFDLKASEPKHGVTTGAEVCAFAGVFGTLALFAVPVIPVALDNQIRLNYGEVTQELSANRKLGLVFYTCAVEGLHHAPFQARRLLHVLLDKIRLEAMRLRIVNVLFEPFRKLRGCCRSPFAIPYPLKPNGIGAAATFYIEGIKPIPTNTVTNTDTLGDSLYAHFLAIIQTAKDVLNRFVKPSFDVPLPPRTQKNCAALSRTGKPYACVAILHHEHAIANRTRFLNAMAAAFLGTEPRRVDSVVRNCKQLVASLTSHMKFHNTIPTNKQDPGAAISLLRRRGGQGLAIRKYIQFVWQLPRHLSKLYYSTFERLLTVD